MLKDSRTFPSIENYSGFSGSPKSEVFLALGQFPIGRSLGYYIDIKYSFDVE